jgi:hypothetical protein
MVFYEGMTLLNTLVFVASVGTRAYALIDAFFRPAEAYVAAGKLTRPAWLIILGLGLVVGVVLPPPISLLNIAALIAAIIYIVDVRPALRELGRPDRRNGPSGQW